MQSELAKPRFQYRHLPEEERLGSLEYEWVIVDTSNGDKIVRRMNAHIADVRSTCSQMNERLFFDITSEVEDFVGSREAIVEQVMDGIPSETGEHVRDFLRKSLSSVWNNGFRYGTLKTIWR